MLFQRAFMRASPRSVHFSVRYREHVSSVVASGVVEQLRTAVTETAKGGNMDDRALTFVVVTGPQPMPVKPMQTPRAAVVVLATARDVHDEATFVRPETLAAPLIAHRAASEAGRDTLRIATREELNVRWRRLTSSRPVHQIALVRRERLGALDKCAQALLTRSQLDGDRERLGAQQLVADRRVAARRITQQRSVVG